jgi:hypothetical protein
VFSLTQQKLTQNLRTAKEHLALKANIQDMLGILDDEVQIK